MLLFSYAYIFAYKWQLAWLMLPEMASYLMYARLIVHLLVMEYTLLKPFFFQSACNNCFQCVARADMATLELSVQQIGRPVTWIHVASRHVSKRGLLVLAVSLPHGWCVQVVYKCAVFHQYTLIPAGKVVKTRFNNTDFGSWSPLVILQIHGKESCHIFQQI